MLRVGLAFWIALAAGLPASAAEDDCAEAIAGKVQARYEAVRDFRAEFEQSTERAGFPGEAPDALRAAGTVFFQKPGRMHWAYTAPAPSFVISDGEGAWVYDPVAKEAQRFELGGEFLSGAALQFLLGEGELLEAFRVRAEACAGDAVDLELEPIEPATFERLVLRVEAESGHVSETRIVDLFGNRTRLAFRNVRFGEVPEPGHFDFEAPPGTRILRVPGTPPPE